MYTTEHRPNRRSAGGFTLVESIIVILLIGALAAVSAVFVVQPFVASRDMTRRAELVDAAETTLDRMTREIRLAVPNSVRINGDGDALEFLRSKTGGRYRRLFKGDGSGDPLDTTGPADTFDVLAGLPQDRTVDTRAAGRDCATNAGDCIVVNNADTAGFDAYEGDTVAALVGPKTGPDELGFDTGESSGPAFRSHSPNQRFQVFDTVVSYVCSGGEITRYYDYGLDSTQQVPPSGGSDNLLARDITACSFDYDDGAGQRHGLVTLDITIQREGETVRLVDQAHVVNAP